MIDKKPGFMIPTRQKADILVENDAPLGAAPSSATSSVREIAGYSELSILGISDQPFEVTVEAGCTDDGPFAAVVTFTSSLDASTGLQKVCERMEPCGFFGRIILTNTSVTPQAQLSLCVIGLPM